MKNWYQFIDTIASILTLLLRSSSHLWTRLQVHLLEIRQNSYNIFLYNSFHLPHLPARTKISSIATILKGLAIPDVFCKSKYIYTYTIYMHKRYNQITLLHIHLLLLWTTLDARSTHCVDYSSLDRLFHCHHLFLWFESWCSAVCQWWWEDSRSSSNIDGQCHWYHLCQCWERMTLDLRVLRNWNDRICLQWSLFITSEWCPFSYLFDILHLDWTAFGNSHCYRSTCPKWMEWVCRVESSFVHCRLVWLENESFVVVEEWDRAYDLMWHRKVVQWVILC